LLEDGVRTYDGAGTYAFYDEVRNEYLHGGNADGHYNSIAFDLTTHSWKPWASPWSLYGVADARHERNIGVVSVPAKPDAPYASEGRYWLYNLDSRTVTSSGVVQYAPGLTRGDFPSGYAYYDGTGMCYVPPINRYWVCTLMGNGQMQILELDPSTTPWTLSRKVFAGQVPNPHQNTCRKMVFFPGFGAQGSVFLVNQADRNVSLFKF